MDNPIVNFSSASQAEASLKLEQACDEAYDKFPDSCSHAVNHVVRLIVDAAFPHRNANGLVDFMALNWREVDEDEGFTLANNGVVVVGGKKEDGHGHVIVIYPGGMKKPSGYQYNYNGKMIEMKNDTLYPLAMSTSIGSWPGAMSRGDKTVWDPWAKDSAFKLVKFYTPTDDPPQSR